MDHHHQEYTSEQQQPMLSVASKVPIRREINNEYLLSKSRQRRKLRIETRKQQQLTNKHKNSNNNNNNNVGKKEVSPLSSSLNECYPCTTRSTVRSLPTTSSFKIRRSHFDESSCDDHDDVDKCKRIVHDESTLSASRRICLRASEDNIRQL